MKIIQFGEGVFLRAFVDWMIQLMNERCGFGAKVTIVQPIGEEFSAASECINAQGGRYTLVLRGVVGGEPVEQLKTIECVERVIGHWQEDEFLKLAVDPEVKYVYSNTTEAGIVYKEGENTFPAKVARLLAARCAAGVPGLTFIPCELIEHNGDKLKECVLKYLDDPRVIEYVEKECKFYSTLVDRIVAGRPSAEDAARYRRGIEFDDNAIDCAEPFHFLVVEAADGDFSRLPPYKEAGLNVVYTRDMAPYRTRKVRFLNGAHTGCVLGAIMDGFEEVEQMVKDPKWRPFMEGMLREEIAPTVPLPEVEKSAYIDSVLERFENPFAHHKLRAISLNSVSKWKVRNLPSLLDYVKIFGKVPERLAKTLEYLIEFYRTDAQVADGEEVKAFFAGNPTREQILANEDFWGMDLNSILG